MFTDISVIDKFKIYLVFSTQWLPSIYFLLFEYQTLIYDLYSRELLCIGYVFLYWSGEVTAAGSLQKQACCPVTLVKYAKEHQAGVVYLYNYSSN